MLFRSTVRLKLGSETQQVEVKADAELVQNTESSLGQTVKEREILDLPLDGRNFSQLGTLQPGVVPLTPGLLEAGGPARANQAYAAFETGGLRNRICRGDWSDHETYPRAGCPRARFWLHDSSRCVGPGRPVS